MTSDSKKTPRWFVGVIIASMLPMLFLMPAASHVLGAYFGSENNVAGWFFPIYTVLSGICAYLCYPERRAVAWILILLMVTAALMLFFCK